MAGDILEKAKLSARIVSDAGGRIVGRTKIQKIAYILEAMHEGSGFSFEYKHYGPYSEDLTSALQIGDIAGFLKEETHSTNWGGYYSIYTSSLESDEDINSLRYKAISIGNAADPVELELVATAILLANQGENSPWSETAIRKPDKVQDGRLEKAKSLYHKFVDLNPNGNLLPALGD